MTTLAHVSDIHFGRHDPEVAGALAADLRSIGPDTVIVSGDLTQRARGAEFRAAREWLESLGLPWLAVPGNHDIPVFDVVRRFVAPFARWRRWLGPEDGMTFRAPDLLVLGVNSARRNRWKEGRIGHAQIEACRAAFEALPPEVLRVLVTHHPFLPAPADRRWTPMARGEEALARLRDASLDLLLSGHQHRAYSADVLRHFEKVSRTVLVVHAGTSMSSRTRGEPNTFNVLRHRSPQLELEVRTYRDGAFAATGRQAFLRTADGWRVAPPDAG